MIDVTEPPIVAFGAGGPRRWIRLTPVPCQHVRSSGALIDLASSSVRPGEAIVLGAGRCQEIPLGAMVDRFHRVTLVDQSAGLLEEAVTSRGLGVDQNKKIQTIITDMTGVTAGFLGQVAERLDLPGDLSAELAAEGIASLAESIEPAPFTTGQRYDLVVASCVLCQLHLETCNRTIALFARKFPGQEAVLRQSPAWIHALYGLARRMEETFLEALYGLAAPAGRIYLSDTVQSAFLHPTPEGDWITDGVYRMTRTVRLSDYLDNRFRIEREGSWHWIIEPSKSAGMVGRIYNTQGLVLSLLPA